MPKPENIINKGFDKNPKNINRTGANRKPISAILKELLNEKIVSFELHLTNEKGEVKVKKGELKSKHEFNTVVATMLLQKAISGDLKAMEIIMDRTEGKAMQTIDHNIKEHGANRPPLEFFDNGIEAD